MDSLPASTPAPEGWLPLPELGLIRASGPETRSFLQNQLSNDAARVTASQGQLSGYCSAKGRLLAVLGIASSGEESFDLNLPAEILAPTLKRLKMFVLRSKLTLEDASAALPAIGLIGSSAEVALQGLGLLPASAAWASVCTAGGISVQRLPGSPARLVLRASNEALAAVTSQLALPALSTPDWQAAEVQSGLPTVLAATVDHFVPQTIDLDLAGGVSFTKGCYPGQEIVARVHYLGRLKARLHRAQCTASATAGMPVYLSAGDGQSVGEVMSAASLADGRSALLLTINLGHTGSELLRLGAVDGPALSPPALVHSPAQPAE